MCHPDDLHDLQAQCLSSSMGGLFTTLKGDKALTYRAALGTGLDPAVSAFAVASAVVASCPSARRGVVAVAVVVAVSA